MVWILAAFIGPLIGSHCLHFFSVDCVGSYAATALLAFIALPLLFFVPLTPRSCCASILCIFISFNKFSRLLCDAILHQRRHDGHGDDRKPISYVWLRWLSPARCRQCYSVALIGHVCAFFNHRRPIARFGAQKIALMGVVILLTGCAWHY